MVASPMEILKLRLDWVEVVSARARILTLIASVGESGQYQYRGNVKFERAQILTLTASARRSGQCQHQVQSEGQNVGIANGACQHRR